MTPAEYADELVLANIFRRPPNQYILDKPFYPYVPTPPKNNYTVNFYKQTPTSVYLLA